MSKNATFREQFCQFCDRKYKIAIFPVANWPTDGREKWKMNEKSRELVAFSKRTSAKSGGVREATFRGGSRPEIGEIFVSDCRKSGSKSSIFWSSYYTQKVESQFSASPFSRNMLFGEALNCRSSIFTVKTSPEQFWHSGEGLTGNLYGKSAPPRRWNRQICPSRDREISVPEGLLTGDLYGKSPSRRGLTGQFIREIWPPGVNRRVCGLTGQFIREITGEGGPPRTLRSGLPRTPKCRKSWKKVWG